MPLLWWDHKGREGLLRAKVLGLMAWTKILLRSCTCERYLHPTVLQSPVWEWPMLCRKDNNYLRRIVNSSFFAWVWCFAAHGKYLLLPKIPISAPQDRQNRSWHHILQFKELKLKPNTDAWWIWDKNAVSTLGTEIPEHLSSLDDAQEP